MITQVGPIAEAAKLVAFSERRQVAEVRLRTGPEEMFCKM